MKELLLDPNIIEATDLTIGEGREPFTEREMAVFKIVNIGLSEVDRRYGKEGLRPQEYHNKEQHSLDVIEAGTELADAAIANNRIEATDKELLIVGLAFHDIERDSASGANEAASARIACQLMRSTGVFSDDDIAKVYRLIMATEVHFDNGIMHQSAELDDYLSQLAADADLSSLGRPPQIYWDRAMRYIKELKDNNHPDQAECLAFALSQDEFLRNHHFYTAEANQLFPYKVANIRFTQFMQRFYAGKHLPLLQS